MLFAHLNSTLSSVSLNLKIYRNSITNLIHKQSFMKTKTIAFLIFVFACQIITNAQKKEVFIFCYFKGKSNDGLHLAYSIDGYKWTALNNDKSFLKPTAGNDKLMRDPNIVEAEDGKFHMVWTLSWTEKSIGYASSYDLIHWSEQKEIPVMKHEDGARNAWAPEIFFDQKKKEYVIYWASTIKGRFPKTDSTGDAGYNHRMYYVTTKDFINFSPTKLLYDKGFNVIDASIQKIGNKYVMFLKDETKTPTEKNIRIATSKSLLKRYSKASKPITGNYWAEGPTPVQIGDDWVVYFDKYRDHQFGAIRSKDLKNWTDISNEIQLPKGIRHGSIFKVSVSILEKLKAYSSE